MSWGEGRGIEREGKAANSGYLLKSNLGVLWGLITPFFVDGWSSSEKGRLVLLSIS